MDLDYLSVFGKAMFKSQNYHLDFTLSLLKSCLGTSLLDSPDIKGAELSVSCMMASQVVLVAKNKTHGFDP